MCVRAWGGASVVCACRPPPPPQPPARIPPPDCCSTHLGVLAAQAQVVHGVGEGAPHEELGRQVVDKLGVGLPNKCPVAREGARGEGGGGEGKGGGGGCCPQRAGASADASGAAALAHPTLALPPPPHARAATPHSLPVVVRLLPAVHQAVVHAPGHCARAGRRWGEGGRIGKHVLGGVAPSRQGCPAPPPIAPSHTPHPPSHTPHPPSHPSPDL